MKRLFVVLVVSSVLIVSSFTMQTVGALDFFVTPEHEQRIRQNCVGAQATLYRLHASDALLRVNHGKLYENISTKLMAPLNSRIALNRHQGLKLTATTLEYDRQIDIFRTDYRAYEEAMSDLLDSNCSEDPSGFYGSVLDTREKRQRLHEDTKTLTTLLEAYKTEFEDFSRSFEGENQ